MVNLSEEAYTGVENTRVQLKRRGNILFNPVHFFIEPIITFFH